MIFLLPKNFFSHHECVMFESIFVVDNVGVCENHAAIKLDKIYYCHDMIIIN